jgi:transposase-like protein
MASEPTTLQEAIIYFADPANCREYLSARRWPKGVTCPRCGSKDVLFLEKYNRWHCRAKHNAPQFTLKTGTIMEDSPVSLDKWMLAMWQIVNCKNGISSYEIHRAIGVTQKTAWFLDHRIRLALHVGAFEKLSGHVEVDETFVGGKARNMHTDEKARKIQGRRGPMGKAIVAAVLERGGKVKTKVIDRRKKKDLQAFVREHVEPKSALYSDALKSYDGLDGEFLHQVIDHPEAYVDGQIHTNGLENFWSLL